MQEDADALVTSTPRPRGKPAPARARNESTSSSDLAEEILMSPERNAPATKASPRQRKDGSRKDKAKDTQRAKDVHREDPRRGNDTQKEKDGQWQRDAQRNKDPQREKEAQDDDASEEPIAGTSTLTTKKRKQVVFSRDQENQLADYIESYPLIWKANDPNHHNSDLVNQAWRGATELSLMIGVSGEGMDKLYGKIA